ncbi:MAG TPA: methylmalonyl-CoA mutase family protein [Caulobacteraceae bacterium]|nr:methylmalonyl-CoA mutase family protein [Caulobacteraceae bacterium]
MAAPSPADPDTIIPLADGFPAPDREAWLALVEKTLKGAPLETLTRETLEGLPIQPLYEAAETAFPARSAPGWDARALIAHGDAAGAGAQALADLAEGARSLLIRLDPTGQAGVAIGSAAGLERALQGVLLDAAPVALDAGFLGPQAADWLGALGKDAPAAQFAFHLDPLSAFAEGGARPGPIEAHLIAAATVAARLAAPYPKASLFLASGRVVHEAGGGEAAELAFAIAAALAYAKALTRAGLAMDDAFGRIVLGLAADADYFLGVAKLRAARRLWSRLAGACGVAAQAKIEARSSGRMLTRADPWTNMIRLTAAAFAAATGGADVIVLGAFTDALGAPTAFARRQSRNIQLVLAEEAHLGRVVDPAGGSGYLETLTDALARAAWERFQAIESAGGAVRALEAGIVAEGVDETRAELKARLGAKQARLLGVTDFPVAEGRDAAVDASRPAPVDAPSTRLPGPDSRCPPLTALRLEDLA